MYQSECLHNFTYKSRLHFIRTYPKRNFQSNNYLNIKHTFYDRALLRLFIKHAILFSDERRKCRDRTFALTAPGFYGGNFTWQSRPTVSTTYRAWRCTKTGVSIAESLRWKTEGDSIRSLDVRENRARGLQCRSICI